MKKKFNSEGNNKQNLTSLAESILSKSVDPEKKAPLIERSLLILDEYGIEKVVTKSSGSRLIQACLKYGTPTSRELIFLKMMKANMDKILTDNYGRLASDRRKVRRQENHDPHQEQEAP
jgi:hypothetical protein